MQIQIPAALAKRVQKLCDKCEFGPQEFIIDAIVEKLERSYKEQPLDCDFSGAN